MASSSAWSRLAAVCFTLWSCVAATEDSVQDLRMRRALASDLIPRLPLLAQSLIVQDVAGSLFRLDWLNEKLIWATHTTQPPTAEETATFVHPSSNQQSLISFADFSQPHNEPLLTARLLSTLTGQLAYLDYTGETIPLKLGMEEVLHQSPFKTPLFPETLLIGQQRRGVTTIDFDRGEAVRIGCAAPFLQDENYCQHVCALQDSDTRQLEIASVTTTIGAINSTTHNPRWKLNLTQVLSVGEPPFVEGSDSECELYLREETNGLDGLQLWRSAEDQRRRTWCEEARVARAVSESVAVSGRTVSIDLCGLVEVVANDEPPMASWKSVCAQRGIVARFSFLFPILHVFPLKQLDTNNNSMFTLDRSIASPPTSVKLIPPDLQHALHGHLLSRLTPARDSLEWRTDLDDTTSIEQKTLLIQSLLTSAKPTPRDTNLLERSLYLPLHNDRHPELKGGGRNTLSFSTVIPAGDGEIYVAVLSPPKRNARSFGALSIILSLPSLFLIGLGWYMHGTLQRPCAALAPHTSEAIQDAPESLPKSLDQKQIDSSPKNETETRVTKAQSPRIFKWPKLKLKFGRRTADDELARESDRSQGRAQRKGAQRIVNLVRHLGNRVSRQTMGAPEPEVVEKEREQEETELRVIPEGSRLSSLIENGRLDRTFTNWQLIGQGGFGSVFRAEHKLEPRRPVYALKLVELQATLNGEFKGFREVTTNRSLLSKYVVRYFTWWCEEPHFLPMPTTNRHIAVKSPPHQQPKPIHPPRDLGESIFQSRRALDRSPISSVFGNNLLLDESKLVRDLEDDLLMGEGTVSETTSGDGDTRPPVTVAEETRDNILFMETDKQDCSNEISNQSVKASRDFEFKRDGDGEDHSSYNDETSTLRKIKEISVPITLVIQMEWCSGMTLRQWLDRPERNESCLLRLSDCDCDGSYSGQGRVELLLFKQLVKGLRDIHTHGIVHRDLKPDNIFIDPVSAGLKIGDFGLSKILQTEKEDEDRQGDVARSLISGTSRGQIIGTPGYAAPEGGAGCSEKADIYSSSLILLELLAHKPTTVHERHKLLASFREFSKFPDYFEKEQYTGWKVLLLAMAAIRPEERPSAELILQILKQSSVAHSCHGYKLNPVTVTEFLLHMIQSSSSTTSNLTQRNGDQGLTGCVAVRV